MKTNGRDKDKTKFLSITLIPQISTNSIRSNEISEIVSTCNLHSSFNRQVTVFELIRRRDLIISRSMKEHLNYLWTVLALLSTLGETLNLKKWFLSKVDIDSLGHVVQPGKPDISTRPPDTIRGYNNRRTCLTSAQLWVSVAYFTSLYRFSDAKPHLCSASCKKYEPSHFGWLNENEIWGAQNTRASIYVISDSAVPRHNGGCTLDTYACDRQFGCTSLLEQPERRAKHLRYWWRSLNKADQAGATTHRPCFTVIKSIVLLRPYLEGLCFYTPNEPQRACTDMSHEGWHRKTCQMAP